LSLEAGKYIVECCWMSELWQYIEFCGNKSASGALNSCSNATYVRFHQQCDVLFILFSANHCWLQLTAVFLLLQVPWIPLHIVSMSTDVLRVWTGVTNSYRYFNFM
jgi:hypothetical protein